MSVCVQPVKASQNGGGTRIRRVMPSQRELAAGFGASRRTVQDWEAGVKHPSAERLQPTSVAHTRLAESPWAAMIARRLLGA